LAELFEHTTLYCEVLLPLALDQAYTYRVPFELNEEVSIGKRVVVQFGSKRIYSGLIKSISEEPPKGYQAKYILSVLDDLPILSDKQLPFWKWIASYYMCSLGEVMNAALPSAMKLESQSKLVLRKQVDLLTILDESEKPIVEHLQKLGELSIDQADKLSGKKNIYKIIQSLYDKEIIWINEELHHAYQPKTRNYVCLDEAYRSPKEQKILFESLETRASKQLEVLMRLITADKDHRGVDKLEFISKYGLSPSSVKSLIDKGILFQYEEILQRTAVVSEDDLKTNQLNEVQQGIYESLMNDFQEKPIALLQGITSSGKTHIYIALIEEMLRLGKQVLYLLPEISLTTQLIRRIQAYFGNLVMVTHSRFNANERVEIWYKLLNKEISILMAPRSGVFMPFSDLGLVIVDEEHENSFKQSEPSPRYNARDASIVLAQIHDAKVLLGSATPSIESNYNALAGKYGFAHLESRYSGVHVPAYHVVDMRAERRERSNVGIFSRTLLKALEETKAAGQQSILFLNRKGYVPITECTECSWTPRCIRCDISLTYYRKDHCLKCHFCGYQIKPLTQCPACSNTEIKMSGYGTERIEAELQTILPDLIIQRFDQVTARTKKAYEDIIGSFERGETDVLVGTQMLTKGLDFQNVLTVGILDADHALNFPDFRSFERSFQQMIQVGGRAGRRDIQGNVFIQTNQPEHHVIDQVVNHDYRGLYEKEIAEREKFQYPPFNRLITITIKHKDFFVVEKAADYLNWMLRPLYGDFLLGPMEPHVSRIRSLYIRNFLLKLDPSKKRGELKTKLKEMIAQFKKNKDYKSVRVIVDVDPY
jgi:primosomal protein N' (replication factor Y)